MQTSDISGSVANARQTRHTYTHAHTPATQQKSGPVSLCTRYRWVDPTRPKQETTRQEKRRVATDLYSVTVTVV